MRDLEADLTEIEGAAPSAQSNESLIDAVAQMRTELERTRQDCAETLDALRRAHTAALAAFTRRESAAPEILAPDEAAAYQRLARSALMDADWYRRQRPDLADSGVDPVLHYLRLGWREGLDPGPAFDGRAYLEANSDVGRAGVNPLSHYLEFGAAEHRPLAAGLAVPPTADPNREPPQRIAITADLRTRMDYLEFQKRMPQAFADETEKAVRDYAIIHGTTTEFLGALSAAETYVGDGDLREWLVSGGLSSRQRAIADEVVRSVNHMGIPDHKARVYGHEAITHLAGLMGRRFPLFVGSEYAPTAEEQRAIAPALHNDVCRSRFADATFDVIFSCDVLEHVYDRDAALREAARTLKRDGLFLATLPFDFEADSGWLTAELRDGEVFHHLVDPIYHGNPMDEANGSLVFELPGWDIVERAKAAGFVDAVMRFICDEVRGITASSDGRAMSPRGVFVLVGAR